MSAVLVLIDRSQSTDYKDRASDFQHHPDRVVDRRHGLCMFHPTTTQTGRCWFSLFVCSFLSIHDVAPLPRRSKQLLVPQNPRDLRPQTPPYEGPTWTDVEHVILPSKANWKA